MGLGGMAASLLLMGLAEDMADCLGGTIPTPKRLDLG
jgi:hypothetical protein